MLALKMKPIKRERWEKVSNGFSLFILHKLKGEYDET